jgi:hypothetical protein
MSRRFIALSTSFAAGLLLPAAALATITELGASPRTTTQIPSTTQTQAQTLTGTQRPTGQSAPSCPATPCLAVSRVTGFQLKVGGDRNPFVVPRAGSIVAWSITLGSPNKGETAFFDSYEGGPPEAGIAVLQAGKSLQYRLVAQSPTVLLKPYFGVTAQSARAFDPGQEGLRRRPQCPDMGTRAGPRAWPRRHLAREPPEIEVQRHNLPGGTDDAWKPHPVRLPVFDGTAHLHRHADLHSLAA